jgi:2-isopropylmalate synthase
VIISIHPHNDRGCAVADSELALLAGGDRIEGTLFGNGERTGNADIITIALNMFMHGIDPGLNLEDMPRLVAAYERLTALQVNPRQPYGGELVFTAFSGSHQDAIAKGLKHREENAPRFWNVPYLPIDPKDVGRDYESDVIRINSQSGKGGIGYLMETKFGFILPAQMREEFGYKVKNVSDRAHKELSPDEVKAVFDAEYLNISEPLECKGYKSGKKGGAAEVTAECVFNGKKLTAKGAGNGVLDAVTNAFRAALDLPIAVTSYHEHALEHGSASRAAAYVGITDKKGVTHWAAGVDNDIIFASVKALAGAVNKAVR